MSAHLSFLGQTACGPRSLLDLLGAAWSTLMIAWPLLDFSDPLLLVHTETHTHARQPPEH